MSDWRAAWEIHKHAAAEAAHVRWMQTKQSHGFADHPWAAVSDKPGQCAGRAHYLPPCPLPQGKHHSDMIPFADLSPEIAAYDYDTAIIGFQYGYEARDAEMTEAASTSPERQG